MYIVMYPSCSEGRSKDTAILENYDVLQTWLLNHHGDLKRVRIFEATELGMKLIMESKDEPTS